MTNLSQLLRDLKAVNSRKSNFGVKRLPLGELPPDILSEISVHAGIGPVRKVNHLALIHKRNYQRRMEECEQIIRRMLNYFVPFAKSVLTYDQFNRVINEEDFLTDRVIINSLLNLYNQLGDDCLHYLSLKYPLKFREIIRSSRGNPNLFFWELFLAYHGQLGRNRTAANVNLH